MEKKMAQKKRVRKKKIFGHGKKYLDMEKYFGSKTFPVKKYVEKVGNLRLKGVSIYEPLPIENESRKIPKSGWHKGTPFYGNWTQRNKIRNVFIESLEEYCEKNDINLITNNIIYENDVIFKL